MQIFSAMARLLVIGGKTCRPESHLKKLETFGLIFGKIWQKLENENLLDPLACAPCRSALEAGSRGEKCGEAGIRTLGTLLGYNALAKRRFRPLSHLTKHEPPEYSGRARTSN
jgi:transposase InsO family protein